MLIQLNQAPKGGLPDLDEFFKKLSPGFKKKRKDPFEPHKSNWKWWTLIILILLAVLLGFSSRITVKHGENLVITRFGAYHATEGAGEHWTIPLIDDRIIVNLKVIQSVPFNGLVLTEDGSLVTVSANLAYVIQDPRVYLFSGQAAGALQAALSQATLTVLLKSKFADLLDNANWKSVAVNISQNLGDLSTYGIKVTGVEVQSIRIPDALAGDFNTTLANAEGQAKQLTGDANAFAVNLQPLAAQKAASSLAYADAAKFATMVAATRDAAEFNSLVPAYDGDANATLAYLPLLLANNWRNIRAITAAGNQNSITQRGGSQAAYLRWQSATQTTESEAN